MEPRDAGHHLQLHQLRDNTDSDPQWVLSGDFRSEAHARGRAADLLPAHTVHAHGRRPGRDAAGCHPGTPGCGPGTQTFPSLKWDPDLRILLPIKGLGGFHFQGMAWTGQFTIWAKWAPPLERSKLTSIAGSGKAASMGHNSDPLRPARRGSSGRRIQQPQQPKMVTITSTRRVGGHVPRAAVSEGRRTRIAGRGVQNVEHLPKGRQVTSPASAPF